MHVFRHLLQKSSGSPWVQTFKNFASKTAVIPKALYGLKSTGAAFKTHLARCMESLGYLSSKVNPELWLKLKIKMGQRFAFLLHRKEGILYICYNSDALLQWLVGQRIAFLFL